MDPALRVVTHLPLVELWNEMGSVPSTRERDLDAAGIRQMLRVRPVRFVIAELDKPLRWLATSECFQFWTSELRDHVCSGVRYYLDDYPGAYCYAASEWQLSGSREPVVVLERHH